MKFFTLLISILFTITCLCTTGELSAQYKVKGTVYDSSHRYPVELVTVMSSSGKGTFTDAYGEYEIDVKETDSIWFSYLDKPTVKFPVLKMVNTQSFDISLQISIPTLREVRIRPRDYRQDSLQNREDYAKVFNFQRPGLSPVTPQYGAAAGFDVVELINVFRFRRNRNMRSFQERLIAQEKEKFVKHRFNKALVRRLTNAPENAIDSFMNIFRPPFWLTAGTNDYDFQKFIKDSYDRFKNGLPPMEFIIPDDEFQE